ncbi:MAG: PEP-CTERM sorting domain-containing protein [Bryobacteraceae bacterium]|nr:PEP-CTERM sorting domain-containing protein [Bryobacteraceae bacterium]
MRFLSMLAFVAATSTFAHASFIQTCAPVNQDSVASGALVNSGTTTVNCAGFTAPSGFNITNISFSFLGTFSDSDSNNGMHQVSFSGTTPWGTFGPFDTNLDPEVGSTGALSGITPGTNLGAAVSPFSIIVNVANTINTNSLPDAAQYTIRATYSYETSLTGVPEPSTLALVGGVLVLAGLRKARR